MGLFDVMKDAFFDVGGGILEVVEDDGGAFAGGGVEEAGVDGEGI